MTDQANFTVRLVEKVKAPARIASRAIRELLNGARAGATGFDALNGSMGAAAAGMRHLQRSGSGVASVLGGNLLAQGVTSLLGLGAAAAGAAAHAVTFGQNMGLAFGQLAKHGATAADYIAHADELAKRFGLDVFDTEKQYAKFLALQFDPKGIDQLFRMGADLRVLGATAEDVQGVFLALGQIRAKGKLQMEELNAQLSERGIATDMVIEQIANIRGRSESSDAIRKLISQGAIDAATGLDAIGKAIQKKMQEQNLGDAGAKFADTTLEGVLMKFRAWSQVIGKDVFAQVAEPLAAGLGKAFDAFAKFAESPEGLATMKGVAQALVDGANGAVQFATSIADAWNSSKEFVSNNWDGVRAGLIGVGTAIAVGVAPALWAYTAGMASAAVATIAATWPLLAIGAAVALVAYGVIKLIENWDDVTKYMGEAWDGLKLMFNDTIDWFSNIGRNIVDGLLNGLKSGWDAYVGFYRDLGNAGLDMFKSVLGIHSPSRVMMDMGLYMGDGLALGMQRSEGLVANAGADMASASLNGAVWGPSTRSLPADAGASSSGAVSVNAPISIEVHVAGGDANEVAEQTARSVRREVEAIFRQLALEV